MTPLNTPPKLIGTNVPLWMVTFADLMSLLLCFFILMLSFSEMNALRFKEATESIEAAFGVKRVVAENIPLGSEPVSFEDGPTGGDSFFEGESFFEETSPDVPIVEGSPSEVSEVEADEEKADPAKTLINRVLSEEIDSGLVEVEYLADKIIIRVQEKGSFASGQAELRDDFIPVVNDINEILMNMPGQVTVSGHTDNIPIRTNRYRSNWDLSTARAASMVLAIEALGKVNSERFSIEGYADKQSIADNDTAAGRAKNRRVEVVVIKPKD